MLEIREYVYGVPEKKKPFFPDDIPHVFSPFGSRFGLEEAQADGVDLTDYTTGDLIRFTPFRPDQIVREQVLSVIDREALPDDLKIGVFPVDKPVCQDAERFFYENVTEGNGLQWSGDQSVLCRHESEGEKFDIQIDGVSIKVKDDGVTNKLGIIIDRKEVLSGLDHWIVSPVSEGLWRLRRPLWAKQINGFIDEDEAYKVKHGRRRNDGRPFTL